MEIYTDEHGNKYYYNSVHQFHRDDKDPITGLTLPAIEWANGDKEWWINGKLHRDDKDPITGLILPAIEHADESKEWWINGVKYILIKI